MYFVCRIIIQSLYYISRINFKMLINIICIFFSHFNDEEDEKYNTLKCMTLRIHEWILEDPFIRASTLAFAFYFRLAAISRNSRRSLSRGSVAFFHPELS